MYLSTHQHPFYPGTGEKSYDLEALGVINAPIDCGTELFGSIMMDFAFDDLDFALKMNEFRSGGSSQKFRTAVVSLILPALREFNPDILILSAGFDGHEDDPLGGLVRELDP